MFTYNSVVNTSIIFNIKQQVRSPNETDNDYMKELQEKYSLALRMWSHWYEEYTKELKIKQEAIKLIKDGRFVEALQLLEEK